MSGWSSTARHGDWARSERKAERIARSGRGWTSADIVALVLAFVIRWELGLAFLALKLWHQASGYEGSVFSFARLKWEGLVTLARTALNGGFLGGALPFSMKFGLKSSGNLAFDAWRKAELERIETERHKLQAAEREFTSYRDDLLQARDREAFERFMQGRTS